MPKRTALVRFVGLLSLCVATTAHAQSDQEPPIDQGPADEAGAGQSPIDSRANAGIILGGKVGGGLGVSHFGATPVFELELGYAPNLGRSLGRSLEIFVLGQYAQPGLDGGAPDVDPRFTASEPFSYNVSQKMVALSLGALFRFDVGSKLLMPYGGAGGRLYLLKTDVKGSVMSDPLGASSETHNQVGLVVLGGVDAFVGPGALLAELSFGWAPLDGYVMRKTNVGALSLAVGYRVML